MLGTAAGMASSVVLAPDAGLARRRCRADDRLAVRPAPAVRRAVADGRGGGARSSSSAVRRIDAAAVAPNQRAVPTAGWSSWRSGMPNPTMIPTIGQADEQDERAGGP